MIIIKSICVCIQKWIPRDRNCMSSANGENKLNLGL